MIKVLTVGDPHFKVNNQSESSEMSTKLVEIVKEQKPDFIVLLGDILHRHETIHVSPLMSAEKLIKSLSDLVPTYVLIGNHDRPNNSNYLTDQHPFGAIKMWSNTYIADTVLDVEIKNQRFLFVPYVPPGKFMDALNTVTDPLNVSCIFAHQEFYGAKMGAIVSQAGDQWSLDYPLVVSGHIHDYDRLQDNIIYVGTPFQHSFGDSSSKTVSMFVFDTGNNGKWEEERIDLGLIKRVIIYLSAEKIHTFNPPPDKLVKLVITGDTGSLKAVAKLDKLTELKKLGVKISFKNTENMSSPIKSPNQQHKMTYKERLIKTISKDKHQLEWFHKIFT